MNLEPREMDPETIQRIEECKAIAIQDGWLTPGRDGLLRPTQKHLDFHQPKVAEQHARIGKPGR